MSTEAQARFFEEVAIRLKQANYTPLPLKEGKIPVRWRGSPLCEVTPSGGVSYRQSTMKDKSFEEAKNRVYTIARTVSEYMSLMESAPQIKASGLGDDYHQLAEFNNVVLAGHRSKHGMMFVTWEWVQDHTALWQGHYIGNYDAAKKDFVTRSGLIPQSQLFNDRQLAEVYRCLHETLESDYPMTYEREAELKKIAEQIEDAVPSLQILVSQSNEMELKGGDAMEGPSMTQQF